MGVYVILDPAGVTIRTQAENTLLPQGAVCYLSDPPSQPPNMPATPAYGPPALPGQAIPWTLAGQMTGMALAAGRIAVAPAGAVLTPPPPLSPAHVTPPQVQSPLPGSPGAGSVYAGTWTQGMVNLLISRPVNGQPGLHVATSN